MATVLRPLSFSELLDRTFFLYRKNFLLFVGITAIPYLVILAVELVAAGLFFAKAIFAAIPVMVLGILIYFLSFVASQAATVVAVSDVHLERKASIGGSYRAIKGSFLRIFMVLIGMVLALCIACVPAFLSILLVPRFLWMLPLPVLLGVPVFVLGISWSLVTPVTVLEGVWLIGAMSRSFFLTKGSLGRIFLIYLIFAIIAGIFTVIVEIPIFVIIMILAATKAGMTALLVAQGLNYVVSFIASTLVAPLSSIGLALIYFDQRVRKEGFDLQLMMATLQPAPAQPDIPVVSPQ